MDSGQPIRERIVVRFQGQLIRMFIQSQNSCSVQISSSKNVDEFRWYGFRLHTFLYIFLFLCIYLRKQYSYYDFQGWNKLVLFKYNTA